MPNIIPDEAALRGTLRSFDEGVREALRRRARQVLESTATAHGCACEFVLHEGYPAVVNDPEAAARVRSHAAAVVGEANVIEPPPVAAAEDFAYFLREVPGAFAFVGMTGRGHASIEDILLLFIYLELGAMVGIYFKTNHMPVRFLVYVGITALTRLLVGDIAAHHRLEWGLLVVPAAILLLAMANLVVRYSSARFPSASAENP